MMSTNVDKDEGRDRDVNKSKDENIHKDTVMDITV
jgi:hypothetical protein